MKTKLLMSLCLISLLAGCAVTPNARLKVVYETYTDVVNSLTELKEAGRFDENEVKRIAALVITGDKLLDKYYEAVKNKKDFDNIDALYIIIGQLLEYKRSENGNE